MLPWLYRPLRKSTGAPLRRPSGVPRRGRQLGWSPFASSHQYLVLQLLTSGSLSVLMNVLPPRGCLRCKCQFSPLKTVRVDAEDGVHKIYAFTLNDADFLSGVSCGIWSVDSRSRQVAFIAATSTPTEVFVQLCILLQTAFLVMTIPVRLPRYQPVPRHQ